MWMLREGQRAGPGSIKKHLPDSPFQFPPTNISTLLTIKDLSKPWSFSLHLYLKHDDDDDDDDDVHQRESVSELRQMCKGFAHLNVNWVSLAMTFISVCLATECHDYYFEEKSQ